MHETDVRQFKVYLSSELIRRLKYAAVDHEASLSALVAAAVTRYLDDLENGKRKGGGRGGR